MAMVLVLVLVLELLLLLLLAHGRLKLAEETGSRQREERGQSAHSDSVYRDQTRQGYLERRWLVLVILLFYVTYFDLYGRGEVTDIPC